MWRNEEVIIQKFGGTSLGTAERLACVAQIIIAAAAETKLVVVVSAMSGVMKAAGTTSRLLEACTRASRGENSLEVLEAIENYHLELLHAVVSDGERLRETVRHLRTEMIAVRRLLQAVEVIREITPRLEDRLVCAGERFSARLLTALLAERGLEVEYTDLSTALSESSALAESSATELPVGYFQAAQRCLAKTCLPVSPATHVVTGFFGWVPGGLLRAVGRGYSDFTAALLAAGLSQQADPKQPSPVLQIWKEVDGIYTADPRRVPAARPLRCISPAEAAELSYFGSEVLHPFTMAQATAANIPISIRNTLDPSSPGTIIANPSAPATSRPHDAESPQRKLACATAVTIKGGVTIATIHSNRMYNAHGFLARVFQQLEEHRVIVDLVSTSEVSISFTVEHAQALERALPGLDRLGRVHVKPERTILALVGEGMRHLPGTAGRLFAALGEGGVSVEMISQGASEINISCVIPTDAAEQALAVVHRTFFTD